MRYFIELAYKGTQFAGFQVQQNAHTIQAEVEKALAIFFRRAISLTGSSRTDTGVHALQNFFHFDTEDLVITDRQVYNLNAILNHDIVIKRIFPVAEPMHCRFSAVYRQYRYFITTKRNPFLQDRAWFYPYHLNIEVLQQAASLLLKYEDFTSFSKRNTQTKTMLCHLTVSQWKTDTDELMYEVKGNRFLRGMVRGLVGTMLQVGRGKLSLEQFRQIIEARDCTEADFSTPPHGLFLTEVGFVPPV